MLLGTQIVSLHPFLSLFAREMNIVCFFFAILFKNVLFLRFVNQVLTSAFVWFIEKKTCNHICTLWKYMDQTKPPGVSLLFVFINALCRCFLCYCLKKKKSHFSVRTLSEMLAGGKRCSAIAVFSCGLCCSSVTVCLWTTFGRNSVFSRVSSTGRGVPTPDVAVRGYKNVYIATLKWWTVLGLILSCKFSWNIPNTFSITPMKMLNGTSSPRVYVWVCEGACVVLQDTPLFREKFIFKLWNVRCGILQPEPTPSPPVSCTFFSFKAHQVHLKCLILGSISELV